MSNDLFKSDAARKAEPSYSAADANLLAETPEITHVGSIHKVGALVQNLPSCNGWTFWHYLEKRELVPIDSFRDQLRLELN